MCGRAVEILAVALCLGGGRSGYIFVSQGGRPFSTKHLRRLLRNLKIVAVTYLFRFSFREWPAEETNHPREVVEAALVPVVGNRTEAVSGRSDILGRRRPLMDKWTVHLGRQRMYVTAIRRLRMGFRGARRVVKLRSSAYDATRPSCSMADTGRGSGVGLGRLRCDEQRDDNG